MDHINDKNDSENLQHQAEHTRGRYHPAVLSYLVILFAVAFLLLLLAYFQQKRENTEASKDAQQQSISTVQSIQNLMADNESLREQLVAAQENLSQKEEEILELEKQLAQSSDQEEKLEKMDKRIQAMDWFWQIDEAYATDKKIHCLDLIAKMEATGLVPYLPVESCTDTGRFSPAQRYQEICEAVK